MVRRCRWHNHRQPKNLLVSYYSNFLYTRYKRKLCQEHFDCFVAKWIISRSNNDTLLKETNKYIYGPQVWMNLYASFGSNRVPSLKEEVEYKWNCINDILSGKKQVFGPQLEMMNQQKQLVSIMIIIGTCI